MNFWGWYLVVVNVIGFILFVVNTWLYSNTADGEVDKYLTVSSILGGTVGILLAILIFDRKAVKGNMMSRVFVACIFVIQVVLALFIKGGHAEKILIQTSAFWDKNKILFVYLFIVNIIAFVAFGIDKWSAINGRSRIRIITLLGLAFIGGSLGGISAMYLFRHKTHVDYFTIGIPLIMVMQLFVLGYLFLI